MFTGLVELLAQVISVEPEPPGVRLLIAAPTISSETALGDSIAVNGCCLTVVENSAGRLVFQAGPETLSRTNLGQLATGSQVNLERSLCLGDRLGGHLVTGHIDGLGVVTERSDEQDWSTFWVSVSHELSLQMAAKGSVTIDGVSLTIVSVEDERFSVQLIPHTLAVTTLGIRRLGDRVNIETDLLAKYIARQMQARG